jgi:hypothetical protein
MPADQPRTRTVGCKMTDNEYERLAAVAEGDGMTLGEWVREVLFDGFAEPVSTIILFGTGDSLFSFRRGAV